MDQEAIGRINSFVRLWELKAAKSLIKGDIGMHLVFPLLLIYPALQQTNQSLGDTFGKYLLVMYCLIIPWDIYMYFTIAKRQIMMHLHTAASALVISITWFGVYYCQKECQGDGVIDTNLQSFVLSTTPSLRHLRYRHILKKGEFNTPSVFYF